MNQDKKLTHAFAVCAYKESPYLTECLDSIMKQTEPSEVFIATSTPSQYLTDIAEKYGIPLYVGNHESGIGRDWNYAYSQATADLVTVAHQDDLYAPIYTAEILKLAKRARQPIMIYTEAYELRGDQVVSDTTLLKVKRLMNTPFRCKFVQNNQALRRFVYAFGSPVSTPSVAYNRNLLPDLKFAEDLGTNLDWDMWERLAKLPGSILYTPLPLVRHRIHPESETSAGIERGYRQTEDYEMYQRFWPKPIAKLLAYLYSFSYSSNVMN